MATDDDKQIASAYNALMQRMAHGSYPPGSQMPEVGDLAHDLGVSHWAILQALSKMERRGTLSREGNDIMFVAVRVDEPLPPGWVSRIYRATIDQPEADSLALQHEWAANDGEIVITARDLAARFPNAVLHFK